MCNIKFYQDPLRFAAELFAKADFEQIHITLSCMCMTAYKHITAYMAPVTRSARSMQCFFIRRSTKQQCRVRTVLVSISEKKTNVT